MLFLNILGFAHFWHIWQFCSFGNLWPHIGHQNVTGPPGALLFNRDQRSHWKNHFNCSFVWLAAWAFIAQISCHRCQYSKISHASNRASRFAIRRVTYDKKVITVITALSEEICLHWARNRWIERLALEMMKYHGFGWEWHKSLPVKGKFTKITKNKKYILKCSEHLVFNQLLMILTNYHDIWSHLVLVGHRNSLWNTR